MASRRLHQLARTQIIWIVAGFCVLQLALALAIEFPLGKVRDPEFAAKRQELRALRRASPQVPFLMALGSSRTKFGLMGEQLGRANGKQRALVYNFGLAGGGPMLQLVCLRRLLADNIRPDFLFVEINASALLEDGGRPLEERWLDGARFRAPELNWLRPYHSHFARFFWRWGWCRLLPCQGQQAGLQQLLVSPKALVRNGWQAVISSVTAEQRQRYTELARSQYERILHKFQFASQSLRAFNDLLSLCRKEGIPFALLVMPEGSAFRAFYPPAGQMGFQALLGRLQQTWHVPLIDARTWVADDGFWDTHHLLPTGALAFTTRFGREVVDPLLARQFP